MLDFHRRFCAVSFFISVAGWCSCLVNSSSGKEAPAQGDYLYQLLRQMPECPRNVQELRQLILKDGLQLKPSMVANRGFHNSSQGSFSFFERAVGLSNSQGTQMGKADFYFGHFTQAAGENLELAQDEGLLIELIVFDPAKGAYNFYELIGEGSERRWFYRGDSFDIFEDNRLLHLQVDPKRPVFGQRLRCSGCHASGGPLMKELEAPNNDWWSAKRPLPLFGLKASIDVSSIMRDLVDAQELADAVREGIQRLEEHPKVSGVKVGDRSLPSGRKYSLREALRPLFSTVEINLTSDSTPVDEAGGRHLQISSASFMDPRLASQTLSVARTLYDEALKKRNQRFPETNRVDSDHGWLGPVKSYSDRIAVEKLMSLGIVSEKFVLATLAVDMARPLFSEMRQSLLSLLPEFYSADWEGKFLLVVTEAAAGNSVLLKTQGARQFLSFYRDMSVAQIRQIARQQLAAFAGRLDSADGVQAAVDRLILDRRSVFESEISKNPRGQILEPGFRVIFPESSGGHSSSQSACEDVL